MDRGTSSSFSRRALLRRTTAAGVTAATLLAVPANLMAAQDLLEDGTPSATNSTGGDNPDAGRDPVPDAGAVKSLLAAFDRVPIVALGEAHGLQEEHDFFATLLRDPAFPTTVNDIVVEFGNARYQGIVDRYLAGEDIAPGELRQAWRNTTQSPGQQWDSPIYGQFFRTVRDVNRALPEAQRLRVHLGDPPVDWGTVRGRDDLTPFLLERDPHFAGVVERVLAEGRNALVVAGAIHLLRSSPGSGQGRGTVVDLIEERRPGSTFVAVPHLGFGDRTCELEPRLSSWPRPALASVAGTWLGSVAAGLVFGGVQMIGPDGKPADPFAGVTLGDLVDAYLYLGPLETLSVAVESPFIYRDDAYYEELKRRYALTGRPLVEDEPHYFRYGISARSLQAPLGGPPATITETAATGDSTTASTP